MRNLLNDMRFSSAIECFALACEASRKHSALAAKSLAEHGKHGANVSGCVRDHFPKDVKSDLRTLATECSRWNALAWERKPKRVHNTTMRKVAAQVAARDGTGFYGPQPMCFERV